MGDTDTEKQYAFLKESYEKEKRIVDALELEKPKIIEEALRDYHSKKESALTRMDEISRAMEALKPSQNSPYQMDLGLKRKVAWVLLDRKKMMTIKAISQKIMQEESSKDFDEVNKIVRLTMNRMLARNELVRFRFKGVTGFHYGIPDWAVDGKVIKGYIP